MSLYLVTGGGGFIGSNIVEELLKRGEKVRILDNFSTGKRENIVRLLDILKAKHGDKSDTSEKKQMDGQHFGQLEVIEGDIRSYHIVREAVDGVDFISHQAALPSVPRSIKDPLTSNEVNVVGTMNILNAAKDAKVKRIVYASSSSVYGDLDVLPKTEEMLPKPLSPYAVSKLAGEKYCQVFTKLYGLETVVFRYFNVFGPNQDPNSQYSAVIPKFIEIIKKGVSPLIYGDGEQSRDFTFVKNVVNANLQAFTSDIEFASGEVFNIACGKRITVNKMVEMINKILVKDVKPNYADPRPGDVKHSLANIGKAMQFLNYQPNVEFETGLKFTIESLENE
ncbi:SDR family oxidoreductase [candidate division KSB1 bacterium]|nr:SDR family oxidoreductase [candidate division KSB1 bacterium]